MHRKIRPYLVWGIAALFSLYQFLMQGSISVMIPDLMEDLVIERVHIGFLSSCFFYTYILFQLPAGFVIDLFGPRKMLILATTTYVIATLLFALSQAFWMAIIARLLMGLMSTLAIVNAFCLAARWFSAAHFGLLVGLTEMIALSGGVIGEGALAHLVTGIGWRMSMLICSGVGASILIGALLFVEDWPQPSLAPAPRPLREAVAETLTSLRDVMKMGQVWVLGIFAGLLFAIVPAFGSLWSIPYLMHRYGVHKEEAALLASIFFLGIALCSPLVGFLATRFRKRTQLIVLGTLFTLILMVAIIYIPHIPITLMAILLFLLGSGIAAYTPAFAIVSDLTPLQAKGIALGLANMLCIVFGAPLLQPIMGHLIEVRDYTVALSILPATLVLALITTFFIRDRGGREASEAPSEALQEADSEVPQ